MIETKGSPRSANGSYSHGLEFAARRRSFGLEQQDIADTAGVPRSSVSGFEHGRFPGLKPKMEEALLRLQAESNGTEPNGHLHISTDSMNEYQTFLQLNARQQRLFRERLKARRIACGISLEKMAKRIKVHESSNVSRYETGERRPALPKAIALAVQLGCTLPELLDPTLKL